MTFPLKQRCMLCSTKDIKILIICNNMQDTASPDLDQVTEGEGTVPSSLSGQHTHLGIFFLSLWICLFCFVFLRRILDPFS